MGTINNKTIMTADDMMRVLKDPSSFDGSLVKGDDLLYFTFQLLFEYFDTRDVKVEFLRIEDIVRNLIDWHCTYCHPHEAAKGVLTWVYWEINTLLYETVGKSNEVLDAYNDWFDKMERDGLIDKSRRLDFVKK